MQTEEGERDEDAVSSTLVDYDFQVANGPTDQFPVHLVKG